MTLLHKAGAENSITLFKGASFTIRGVANCCSAAAATGVSVRGNGTSVIAWKSKQAVTKPIACDSIAKWFKLHTSTLYGVPIDYAWCILLEAIYTKASTGVGELYQNSGGTEYKMWGHETYPTRTWFMTDSDKGMQGRGVMGFMLWLKAQGTGKIGRCHISPWAPGAHGGRCKGAVFSPNEKLIKIFLDEKLKELNAHADAVYKTKGVTIAGAPIEDEVAKLW